MSLIVWCNFVMGIGISIYVHFSATFLLNATLIAQFSADVSTRPFTKPPLSIAPNHNLSKLIIFNSKVCQLPSHVAGLGKRSLNGIYHIASHRNRRYQRRLLIARTILTLPTLITLVNNTVPYFRQLDSSEMTAYTTDSHVWAGVTSVSELRKDCWQTNCTVFSCFCRESADVKNSL